jgi:hypothetical protein
VQQPVFDNLRLLETSAGRLFPRASWLATRDAVHAFVASHRDVFEARRREGRAVDGHGDVHLQHVWFEAGREVPTLVDCIEFNDSLRHIDAAAEVAFLAMDLRYRGRGALAARFLQSYAEAADDYGLFEVVDYFISYRAAVRAKVAAIAAEDAGIAARQRAAAATSARAHMRLAARALRAPASGALVLLAGIVGTGKSSAAQVVAAATEGVVIASDRLRKRMRGLPDDARDGARRGIYTRAAKDAVYAAMLERAAPVLRSGRVAVLDATYESASQRDRALRWAAARGVPVCMVETRAPRAATLDRLARRAAAGRSASDAGPARYEASRRAFAPVKPPRGVAHLVAPTARPGWRARLRRQVRRWRQSTPAGRE